MHGQGGNILVVYSYRAAILGNQPNNHVEAGGFTCAIGA
jgi:hypothetical protein